MLLILTAWPHPARLVRAQMLRVRQLPFVEAAQAAGVPAWRVWLRHALPHAAAAAAHRACRLAWRACWAWKAPCRF